VKAVLTGRLGVPVRVLSGKPEAVEEGVQSFFAAHPTAEYVRLDMTDATPSFRRRLAEATRLHFESESSEPRDAKEPAAWQTRVEASKDLDPSWAVYDAGQGHLAVCLWTSNETMLRVILDGVQPHINPQELWCRIGSWDPDVGGVDHQLGLLTDHLMYTLHQDPESFSLSLAKRPDDVTVTRAIVDFVTPPSVVSGTIAALYLLGLPCDGSLGESEFATLARHFRDFEWMDVLIVAPPSSIQSAVRRELSERTADAVQEVRTILDARETNIHDMMNRT
jgi:hypothetical protein